MYSLKREKDNKVLVKIFNYTSSSKLFSEKNRYFKGNLKPDIQRMVTNFTRIANKNKFIISIISSLLGKTSRKILVLSDRLEHLHGLKELLVLSIKTRVDNKELEEDEIKAGMYVGGMKDYELEDSAEADVIFATYGMAQEALDINKLNTLIMCSSKKNIEQAIGRILRKPIKEGDIYPLVVDIVDNISCFKNWGNLRSKYYKDNDYDITEYNSWDDKVITSKEYLKMIGIKDDKLRNNEDVKREYLMMKYSKEHYEFLLDTGQLEDYTLVENASLDNIF